MAGSLSNSGFLGSNGDPCQFNLSAAVSALTGGSPLFAPGELGKYFILAGNPPSIPYTSGLAKTGSRVYQLVKLDAASGSTFGNVVVWLDHTDYIVSTVASNTKPNDTAGLLVTGSITAAGTVTSLTHDAVNGNYVFIALDGIFPFQNEAGTAVVDGTQILNGATTAGRWFTGAAVGTAPIHKVNGVALSAKAALFQGITTTGDYAHGQFAVPKFVSF